MEKEGRKEQGAGAIAALLSLPLSLLLLLLLRLVSCFLLHPRGPTTHPWLVRLLASVVAFAAVSCTVHCVCVFALAFCCSLVVSASALAWLEAKTNRGDVRDKDEDKGRREQSRASQLGIGDWRVERKGGRGASLHKNKQTKTKFMSGSCAKLYLFHVHCCCHRHIAFPCHRANNLSTEWVCISGQNWWCLVETKQEYRTGIGIVLESTRVLEHWYRDRWLDFMDTNKIDDRAYCNRKLKGLRSTFAILTARTGSAITTQINTTNQRFSRAQAQKSPFCFFRFVSFRFVSFRFGSVRFVSVPVVGSW